MSAHLIWIVPIREGALVFCKELVAGRSLSFSFSLWPAVTHFPFTPIIRAIFRTTLKTLPAGTDYVQKVNACRDPFLKNKIFPINIPYVPTIPEPQGRRLCKEQWLGMLIVPKIERI